MAIRFRGDLGMPSGKDRVSAQTAAAVCIRLHDVLPDREAERGGRALADMTARRPAEMFQSNLPAAINDQAV